MTKRTIVNEVEILGNLDIGRNGNNSELILRDLSDNPTTYISSFTTSYVGGNFQANKKIQLKPMDEQILEATDTIVTDTSYIKVSGNSGAVTLTSVIQVSTGTYDGQLVIIRGMDDINTLTISDGNGVSLAGAVSMVLGLDDILMLMWNGSIWIELSRSNN